jgi:hypothetical protein
MKGHLIYLLVLMQVFEKPVEVLGDDIVVREP